MPTQSPFLNKLAILEITLSVAPGMLIAIFTHNNLWLLASFFSVSSIIPYQSCYFSRTTCLIHLLCTAIIALALSHFILLPKIFISVLVLLGFILAYIDQHNSELQLAVRWIFISIIYSSFHLSNEHYNSIQMICILLFSILGVILGTAVAPKMSKVYKLIWYKNWQPALYYFKYAAPILIALLIMYAFNLKEGEWLVWSSLSVVYLEVEQSRKKAEDRLKSLAIGVFLGIVLTPVIPHYYLLQYIYLTCIFLSLRAINPYRWSFGLRCFFIILYANNNFMEVGRHRVINIILGAIIGCTTSYIIVKLAKKNTA